jgi:hypothetical protein
MTKCPQCGYDETKAVNMKLIRNVMNEYIDPSGNTHVIVADDVRTLTLNGVIFTRKDLWKEPTPTPAIRLTTPTK